MPVETKDILEVIDCYEKDYANLKSHSDRYPTPAALRAMTKQGEKEVGALRRRAAQHGRLGVDREVCAPR